MFPVRPFSPLKRSADPVTGGAVRRRGAGLSAAQLLVVSFAVLVAVGTLGFRWLPGLYAEGREPLSWLDSLFTATSAVCVTGLIVVDTATHFSPFGQLYILVLIQAGGLGMIGWASVLIVALGSRLSLRQDAAAAGGAVRGAAENVPTRSLVRDVIVFTFGVEVVGFLLLTFLWSDDFPLAEAAWHAAFHSVSAFCNAGFSTFSTSLVGFDSAAPTLFVVMALIVVGGLGFLTLEELKLWTTARLGGGNFRLSLHSRLALWTTLVLIVGGALVLGPLEWGNPRTFAPLDRVDRVVNAVFLSVTPRTAGFNTVDYGGVSPAANFATILLMGVGGAPGGTAGGMKVTTIAVLAAMAYCRARARRSTDVLGRTIPETTALRAVGLFCFALVLSAGGTFALAATELENQFVGFGLPGGDLRLTAGPEFLDAMFEAVSAFNTVGLSTGVTAELSTPGRLIVVALMFVGRVGPLTAAAALSRRDAGGTGVRRFAHEDVVVG